MDGNVIAVLIFGAIFITIAIALALSKPGRETVEGIADDRIIKHQDELSNVLKIKLKADTAGFAQRLGSVVKTLESVAEAAYPEQAPCSECGAVFETAVMQHVQGFVEWRDQREVDHITNREPSKPLFYCPQHNKPYEVAARQCYRMSYGYTVNDIRDADAQRERLPLWRYYNIVPAQAERWDEVLPEVAPAPKKRGRKSAADRIREATAAGEDVSSETAAL